MAETTITTPPAPRLLESPRTVLTVMAAAVAVSAAIAFGSVTSQEPAPTGAVVDPRVDYAIRHLGEGNTAEATPRHVDYALRHLVPVSGRSVDYALRHLGE
ncbi:MAG TPA: hypothetical protein VLB85_03870 [Acidimicrobiia bacterium]|nr:hypothetical protein [Acidimicrobiia bacterium]